MLPFRDLALSPLTTWMLPFIEQSRNVLRVGVSAKLFQHFHYFLLDKVEVYGKGQAFYRHDCHTEMALFYDILYGNVQIQTINPAHTDVLLLITSRLAACDTCNKLMHEMLQDTFRKDILNKLAPGAKVKRLNIAFAYTSSDIQITQTPPDFGKMHNAVASFGFGDGK